MKKTKFRFYAKKYVIIICILLLVLTVSATLLIMIQSRKNTIDSMHRRMLDLCKTASKSIDGDLLASIDEEDVQTQSPAFLSIYHMLSVYRNIEDLTYIYAVREGMDEDEQVIYTYVVDTDPEKPAEYGSRIVDSAALFSAGRGIPSVDREAVEDQWGKYYSAYCPVYASNGSVAGVVGIDYTSLFYEGIVTKDAWLYFTGFAVSVLAACIVIAVLTTHLRRQIDDLNQEASSLADDVKSLTKEIVANANEYAEGVSGGNPSIAESEGQEEIRSSDMVDELGRKIKDMQKVLKKYTALAHLRAYTDIMTGVGNKMAYYETVRAINQKIADGTADFVVIFCDINGLKHVNDNHGHEIGDMLVVDSAVILKKTFGADCIYRIGGDEFIVILENITDEELNGLLEKAQTEMKIINDSSRRYETEISFSIGHSRFLPGTDTKFKQVFKRADDSMYQSKDLYYKQNADKHRRSGSEG